MITDPESLGAVLDGYEADVAEIIDRFDAIPSETLFAPVLPFLPTSPCHVLDLGAGTGRDAVWLAEQGHRIWAVEPVLALRAHGAARGSDIIWVDDTLPCLRHVLDLNRLFDLVILNGVLHHLSPAAQKTALRTVAQLMSVSGCAVLSLRHGPAPASRPAFPVVTEALLQVSAECGLTVIHDLRGLPSHQRGNRTNGVTWDWLVLGWG